MRVLLVAPYYKPAFVYGGPVHSNATLCEGLARLGVQTAVFTTGANAGQELGVPLGQPLDVGDVETWYFPLSWGGFAFYSRGLAAACARRVREFDLVLIAALFTHPAHPAARACWRTGTPYVVIPRGGLLPASLAPKGWKKRPYLALVGRRLLNGAAGVQCTDVSEANAIAPLGLRAPVFTVPNALDAAAWAQLPPRGALRQRLGVPPAAPVLLFLGRLHHKKRPDIAVEALAAACSSGLDAHLVLAGPDEQGLGPRLQAQAQHHGCGDRLHLTGLLTADGVRGALGDSDLLLMPSAPASENFGMSAAEAMAAGCPVLASLGVPAGDIAALGGAGRSAECTAAAFGRATVQLLSDRAHLAAMGLRAQEVARARFDLLAVARKALDHYESLVRKGAPSSATTG